MEITISKLYTSLLYPNFKQITTISIGKEIGGGGFGTVYVCEKINGVAVSKLLIKILTNDKDGDKGFQTSIKLQEKLSLKNEEYKKKSLETVDKIVALCAIPQFCFEGKMRNIDIKGYAIANLSDLGFASFDSITDSRDLVLRQKYASMDISKKIKICYSLAKGFRVLGEIYYVHADLNPQNLFVNLRTTEAAIIDFDSGAIMDNPNDTPTTIGKAFEGEWLASEILAELASQTGTVRKFRISLQTDTWSVAVAIHYLLFLRGPYFFLKLLSKSAVLDYLANYRWFEAGGKATHFDSKKQILYTNYKSYVETTLPKPILEKLQSTFNEGYANTGRRTNFSQWETILSTTLNLPCKILFFTSNNISEILLGESITLNWEIENEVFTEINGIDVTGKSQITFNPSNNTDYKLVAKNALGKSVEKTLHIRVNKPPVIHFFKATKTEIGEKEEAVLTWKVDYQTNLYLNDKKLSPNQTEYRFIPTSTQTVWVLRIENQYGTAISNNSITITVHKPPLLQKIWTDKKAITSDDIVTVQWQALRTEEFILTWVVFEEATNSWKQNTKTFPNTITTHTLDIKGSNKECKISLVAKSKYGTSTLPALTVKVVNMPEFQFVSNEIDSIPEITVLPLAQFPTMPTLAINTTQQEFSSYMSYPKEYKSYVDEQNNRKIDFFIFCICLVVVSAFIGFLGSLIL